MRTTASLWSALLGLGLACTGCYAGVGVDVPSDAADDGEDSAGGEGPDGPQDDGGEPEPTDPEPPTACDMPQVGPTPMRRLTRDEYDNTVRDLLGDTSAPARLFAPDEAVAGFSANAVAPLSAGQLEQYFQAGETLAQTAVEGNWDAVVGCPPADAECLEGFVESFGLRAFRRPLSGEEAASYRALLEETTSESTPQEAVARLIHSMLVSPSFLYHLEGLDAAEAGTTLLDEYALASRLSYFLWTSMPDEELLELAAADMLHDGATLEAQARRMLEDGRAEDAIDSFHRQWLGIEGLSDAVRDPELFPGWGPDLAESMQRETQAFAREVVQDGDGTLSTLLTASWSIVDADLAGLYGVELDGPQGRVELDPSQRAGLLTQPSLLTATSHAAQTSWVYRGLLVREKFLCAELPAPPAGVEVNDPNDPGRLDAPACSGCHILIDPVGQGFDRYSPIGTYRLIDEAGNPADDAGQFADLPEIGDFNGPVELANKLAQTDGVHDCMTKQWFRFATRRHEAEADDCALEELQQHFIESGGNVRDLIAELVTSNAFRYRTSD